MSSVKCLYGFFFYKRLKTFMINHAELLCLTTIFIYENDKYQNYYGGYALQKSLSDSCKYPQNYQSE